MGSSSTVTKNVQIPIAVYAGAGSGHHQSSASLCVVQSPDRDDPVPLQVCRLFSRIARVSLVVLSASCVVARAWQ